MTSGFRRDDQYENALTEAEESEQLYAELAKRELARRNYSDYLAYVHGEQWIKTNV